MTAPKAKDRTQVSAAAAKQCRSISLSTWRRHRSPSLGTELTCKHFVPGQRVNVQGVTQVRFDASLHCRARASRE